MTPDDDLRKANWLLQAVVDNIPTMVFLKDAEHLRFEFFNRAGQEILGVGQDALQGKTDHDFFPREQADFFVARDREVLAKNELVAVEEPIKAADGDRWLLTKKIPIRDEQGAARYLLGVSFDITARKHAEAELERVNEQLRTTLAQMVSLEVLIVAGKVAKESSAELVACLERGDPPSLARARELAERLREASR